MRIYKVKPGKLLQFITLLFSVITFLGCEEQPMTSDPVVAVGHGAFLNDSGESIRLNNEFILEAQTFYINTLKEQAEDRENSSQHTIADAEKIINELVEDKAIANGLFIDWLLETFPPSNTAHLMTVSSGLRYDYVNRNLPDLMPKDFTWSKGINVDIANRLEELGFEVFLKTNNSGESYIKECREAGVPIPPPMFTDAWTYKGIFTGEFIDGGSQAELWSYESTSPQGLCLSLPRYPINSGNVGDFATVMGLICLGTQSSKACFWDNPNKIEFERDVPVDISEFLGGADLASNGQGTCSDCHAGENPFIVHPEKAAFSGLPNLSPLAWHDPLVHPNWPQNPGPTVLLDAVSSPGRCDSCHQVGSAGRFPEVSNQLGGYCNAVLKRSIGTGDTMPPFGMDESLFAAHEAALVAACDDAPSTGVVIEVDYEDDSSVISPPLVVDPLYQCATKIAVKGSILDAKVNLFINGAHIDSLIARNPAHEEFNVPSLVAGDQVYVNQDVDGQLSHDSPTVTVRDHTLDYPSGLPAPTIDPALIYECGETIAVRHINGAKLTVYSNGIDPRSGSTSTDWTAIRPAASPFTLGDSFTAEISLCSDTSPISGAESAVAEPATIPAPTFNPNSIFPGQELVTLETLINGSRTNVEEVGTGSLGTFTTPISWYPNFDVATPLGRPLASGDSLTAEQKLCSSSPTSDTIRTDECEDLPAPRIRHPGVGDTYVVVTQSVPGARIHVYDAASIEIGDGSAPVVFLTRPVTGADTLTVIQQVGECLGKTGYRVSVRNKQDDSQPD